MNSRDYQRQLKPKLERIFESAEIRIERSMKLRGRIYSPKVDISVGPFAEMHGERLPNNLLLTHKDFINQTKKKAINKDYIDFKYNPNPRCFIAIELENSTDTDTKHVLGSICNASILAKVGILVVFNRKETLENLKNLFEFAKRVRKIGNHLFKNVAFLTKEDFDQIIDNLG